MMKRLIIAGVLFVLVIAIYLASLAYITHCCDQTTQLLKETVTEYQAEKDASVNAKKLQTHWQKKEKILSVFVNHDRIDDIEYAISVLNVYAKSDNDPIFYEYADAVNTHLHQIMEDTKLTMHSIF